MTAPHADSAPLAHADVIVLDYLAALWAESEDLSPDLRDELMTAVAEYIALRRSADADPIADPGQIVGRLGPPEALVASVRRGRMPMHLRLPVPPRPRPRVTAGAPGPADSTAIALLIAGTFVLPVISPLAGMIMVSASPRWNGAHKAAAWLLVTCSVVAGFLLSVITAAAVYDTGFALAVAYLTAVAGSIIAGISLLPGLFRQPSGAPHWR